MALPLEVEQAYHELSKSRDPEICVRALNSMEGDLGETYLLADERLLFLHSRRIGQDAEQMSWTWEEIDTLRVEEDRPFAYLSVAAGDLDCKLKFSSMDQDELQHLLERWAPEAQEVEGREISEPVSPAPPPIPQNSVTKDEGTGNKELTPLAGFCAAIYALIQVDGNVDSDELELLNRQVGSPEAVARGLASLRDLGTIGLLDRLKTLLDQPQKLCLIANLIEISMADGLLRSTEKRLLKQIQDALTIDDNDYNAIFEIILVKNNLTVFQTDGSE